LSDLNPSLPPGPGHLPEGWSYTFNLCNASNSLCDCADGSAGKIRNCFRFSGGEDHPKKDGSRHGNLFAVARAVIHVDDQTGDISLLDVDDKVWQRSPVPPTLAVANQAPQSVSTSGQPAMPPASSVLPTAEAQSHINWCIANRTSDIGETNCPGEYLSTEPGCILGGGRACLLAKAVAAANRVSETLALDGMARTAIVRSFTWIVPRGSTTNVRYQPFGFTLHDLTKMRSRTTTTQMPMKRCFPVPARIRRPLLSRRAGWHRRIVASLSSVHAS
jgi:hypothetical protein